MLKILLVHMADNNDIPFDRVKAALDSVKMINELTLQEKKPTGNLDPHNINEILDFNMKHLSLEKNKGGLDEAHVSLISDAILVADNYIKNNPEGGGGSKSIGYFIDCYKGFYFALDFSPQNIELVVGEVYNINAAGYHGCGQVIPKPDKEAPTYTRPYLNSVHKNCEECSTKL